MIQALIKPFGHVLDEIVCFGPKLNLIICKTRHKAKGPASDDPHRVLMHLWSRTLAALRVQEAAQPRWVGGRDDVVLSGQDTFSGWPQVPWFQSWGPSLLHTPSGASESAEAGASALTSTKAAAAGLQIPAMVLRPSPRLTEGPGCIFVTGSMGSTLVLTVDSIRFE